MGIKKYSKLCICEYDGTNYCGWQFQSNGESIQKIIEEALQKLYKENIRILGSGRTDAGVHALGQVFHFFSTNYRTNHSVAMSLNCTLPEDISIISVEDGPPGFHPIADAKSKTYRYKILNRPYRAGLHHNRAWHCRLDLDVGKLRDILKPLEGEHDFSSFCMQKSLKVDNTRRINSVDVEKNGDIIDITVNANGFLHNMMRIITGTAVHLYYEGGDALRMKEILEARQRTNINKTAPACGLYLVKVFY